MAGKTLVSRATAFAAGSDLTKYRDWRHIADLTRDDDTREVSQAATEASPIVAEALSVASGEIETALYRGGRYTKDDIDVILTGATTIAKNMLLKLTCDLAFFVLVARRKPDVSPKAISGVPEALEKLAALEAGAAILPFQEVEDAGVMDYTPLDPNRAKADVNANPISTQANRLFGTRSRTVSGRLTL